MMEEWGLVGVKEMQEGGHPIREHYMGRRMGKGRDVAKMEGVG